MYTPETGLVATVPGKPIGAVTVCLGDTTTATSGFGLATPANSANGTLHRVHNVSRYGSITSMSV
ncbi:hypothetical protein [Chitinophaga filiformis]|uniref:Uncharacterized protein n=1 Tax=Chitinophaga filiformis TaxID=104663 RepID=A0ABY4I5J8_CHIFI|nr:hypothetical protein [Chitinophaga filiformis]UPK70403.1 hypothetical protein MYF79_03730 [Chitinophaga filiformis]